MSNPDFNVIEKVISNGEKLAAAKADLDNVCDAIGELTEEVKGLRRDINDMKLKVAAIAGSISTAVTLIVALAVKHI